MASYAAVLSLMSTLNQINKHPSPSISLDQSQVDSVTQYLTFFQDFLERRSSSGEEDDDLESRITAAAYAAEDVIDSHIADQIDHARSGISTVDLCQCLQSVTDLIGKEVMKIMGAQTEDSIHVGLYRYLQRVIGDTDLIRREVMEMKKVKNMGAQQTCFAVSTASGRPASALQNSSTVDFDDVLLIEVLDKLTGQERGLQIIPIVGMGGIEPEVATLPNKVDFKWHHAQVG